MPKKYLSFLIAGVLLLPNHSNALFEDKAAAIRFIGTLITAAGLYLFVTEPGPGQPKRERDSLFVSGPMIIAGYIIASDNTKNAFQFTQKNILVPLLNYLDATRQYAEKKVVLWFDKKQST